eukprot:5791523-Prymnesium_polylepis.1
MRAHVLRHDAPSSLGCMHESCSRGSLHVSASRALCLARAASNPTCVADRRTRLIVLIVCVVMWWRQRASPGCTRAENRDEEELTGSGCATGSWHDA